MVNRMLLATMNIIKAAGRLLRLNNRVSNALMMLAASQSLREK